MFSQIRELWKILKDDPSIAHEPPILKRLMSQTFIWLVICESVFVAQMVPVKFFFDELGRPERRVNILLLIALITTVLYMLSNELQRRMGIVRQDLDWRQWRVWWGYGHRQELRQSTDWHIKHGTGEKESLVGKNISKFESMVDYLIFDTVPTALRVLFVACSVWFLGWTYGIIVLTTLIGYGISLKKTERKMKSHRHEHREQLRKVEMFGSEITSNWRTIKEAGAEERFSDRNDQLLEAFIAKEGVRNRTMQKRFRMQSFNLSFSRGVLFTSIAITSIWQTPQLGSVVLIIGWLEQMYGNLWRFADFQIYLSQGLVAIQELIAIMKLKPTVRQAKQPVWSNDLEPSIVCTNLQFSYPEKPTTETLQDINLNIPAYTATALVGESGSGKSTLVSLLQRAYDPCGGSIEIGGIDLRALDFHRYRQEGLSIVSQGVQLFDGSIAGNIRQFAPGASDADVHQAAKAAHAHEFIAKLPGGYNEQVGDNGTKLSGGEKQRIAIARALIRHPKILILDEATSALDAVNQDFIQQSINELIASRTCTVIIIAHRFSTIMSVDQVVVMDNGRIAERGTHEELTRLNGLYSRLRDMEARGLL